MEQKIGVGTFSVNARMRQYVNEVLDSGRISYGPFCREFERQFAALHDSAFGVLSNSGTSSLQVALHALKELNAWQDGDEVIVPSLTFVATVNVILQNNLKPVLVDIEPTYYGIDTTKIEEAINSRTRAIIPVHLFGMPCNMTEVMRIARHYGLKVVEDSCECMFVGHAGHAAGSFGDVGCFSTYVAHLLTTGVGGIATTNDPELAALMRSLVNHGRDGIYIAIDDDAGLKGHQLQEVINRRFRFERVGYSYRITELEAALGLAQLEDWESMIEQRQLNAAILTQALSKYDEYLQLPSIRPRTGHAFMMYPIVVKHADKSLLCHYLEEHGIETRDMLPLTNQPVYASWCRESDYPVAQWINRSGFYIACHQGLIDEDLYYISDVLDEFFFTAKKEQLRKVA